MIAYDLIHRNAAGPRDAAGYEACPSHTVSLPIVVLSADILASATAPKARDTLQDPICDAATAPASGDSDWTAMM